MGADTLPWAVQMLACFSLAVAIFGLDGWIERRFVGWPWVSRFAVRLVLVLPLVTMAVHLLSERQVETGALFVGAMLGFGMLELARWLMERRERP